MEGFVREDRYVVLKRKDVEKYLTPEQKDALAAIAHTVAAGREADKRGDLACVVVEEDWPEYDTVWFMIEGRMMGMHSLSCRYRFLCAHLGLEDLPELRVMFWSEYGGLVWEGDSYEIPTVDDNDCQLCRRNYKIVSKA